MGGLRRSGRRSAGRHFKHTKNQRRLYCGKSSREIGRRSRNSCGQQPISRLRPDAGDREVHGEECALSFATTFSLDRSAMELYKMLNDGEADAETTISACRCAVALNKRFEYMRE